MKNGGKDGTDRGHGGGASGHDEHDYHEHMHGQMHTHMVKDFRKRFWISLAVSFATKSTGSPLKVKT